MATPVRIVVEFPEEIKKLPKNQADALKEAFRTQLANVLKAKDMESLASLVFENVSGPGGGFMSTKKAGKKGAKKGAKKGSKKSNK